MKKEILLLFFVIAFTLQNLSAQRILWSEGANGRIRSANFGPTALTSTPVDFVTGITNARNVEVDQINNVLYYHNFSIEDIMMANLTTGAGIGPLITTGAMAGYYDFSFSDNAGAVFATANDEVQGVYSILTPSGTDTKLNLGIYSDDVFTAVAVDDGNEYIYLGNSFDGWIYRTGFSGGTMVPIVQLTRPVDISYDRFNNDLYIVDEASGYDLHRYDLDGGAFIFSLNLGFTQVQSVQAYPQFGKIYFSRANTGIFSLNTDGSGTTQLVGLSGVGDIFFDIVEDWTTPVFTALNPANNSTGASTTPSLSMTFDENVKLSATAGTGNDVSIRILRLSDNSVVQTVDRSSPDISIVNNTVTITGINILDPAETYHVLVGGRVFSDLSGNNFGGIWTNTGWRFQTVPGVSLTVPVNDACVSTYSTLDNIVISEADVTNFKTGANQVLTLTFSGTGYAFNAGVGTVAHTAGRNITTSAISVTSTTLTITYSVSAQTLGDALTISGLQINSDNAVNGDVKLIRSGGTGVIDGLPANTVVATIGTQASPAAPAVTFPAGEVFCINSDVSGVLVNATGTALKWYADEALTSEITALSGSTAATGPDLGVTSSVSQVFNRYITQTTGGCESLPSTATITIDPGPQAISTGFTAQTVCDGPPNGAAHITDVNGEGLTDYTVSWYDNAFIALGITGPSLTNVMAGDYNALVTSNATGCSNYAATVTIPNNPEIPVLSTSSTANTQCESPNGSVSATVQNLQGSLTDYAFTWYNGPDTESAVLPETVADLTGVPAGSYTVTARYIPTGCVSAPATTSVSDETVYPEPTAPSGEVCESAFESGSANVDLTTFNSTITGGNADWTVTWYDGSANAVTNVVITSGQEYSFVVRSLTTGCETTSTVPFTVFTQPTPSEAGTDKNVCGATTVLEGNTPVYGIGTWSILSGTGGFVASPSDPNSAFTGTPGTIYELQWEIYHVPQCPVSTSSLMVTLTAPPTTANAGSDQIVCDVPAALTANTPVVGTGLWSIVTGTGGTFDDVSDPTTSFTGIAGNVYQLRWTISNGSCPVSTSDVTIRVTPPPTVAAAGTDLTNCGNAVTLNANTPAVGTGSWSVITGTGGAFASVSNPASSFTGTTGTTYTLRWSISNPGCLSSTDDVNVTFVAEPSVAAAGEDIETCGSSANLAGNVPAAGTGTWSIVSGAGGTFTDPAMANTSFTGVPGSTYVLRWTISSGADCPVSTDEISLSLVAPPTAAAAGADATVCDVSTALAANTPAVGTGQWSIVNGAGGSFSNTASPTSSFSGTANTTYTLRWTISNGICPSSTDEISITFVSAPTVAQAGDDQSVCASGVTLSANAPTSGTGTWSVISGPGGTFTSASSPTSGFSGTPGTTYTLRWTIAQNGCPSSTDDLSVALRSAPLGTGSITGNAELCQGESGTFAVSGITGADLYNWTMPAGMDLSADGEPSASVVAESGTGGTVSVTPVNGCGNGTPASLPVSVLETPQVSINLPAPPFPEDPVTFSLNISTAPQSISWDFGEGGSSADAEPVYAYGTPGNYIVSVIVVGTNGCEGSDSKTLQVSNIPDLDATAIKNVITANGDDKNGFLHIVNLDRYPENEVRFLDRWGVEVFSASNYANNWDARGKDGQFLPAGQYICVVKFRDSGKVISRAVSIVKGR